MCGGGDNGGGVAGGVLCVWGGRVHFSYNYVGVWCDGASDPTATRTRCDHRNMIGVVVVVVVSTRTLCDHRNTTCAQTATHTSNNRQKTIAVEFDIRFVCSNGNRGGDGFRPITCRDVGGVRGVYYPGGSSCPPLSGRAEKISQAYEYCFFRVI